MRVLTCEWCLKEFTPKGRKTRYCSRACSKDKFNISRRTGYSVRNCVVCDKEFTPNCSVHKICSEDCKKVNTRNWLRASNYGLSPEDYNELFANQNNSCAICKRQNSDKWAIDHDHSCCEGGKTCGKCVRGILCFPCNQALGLLGENVATLREAVKYMESKC